MNEYESDSLSHYASPYYDPVKAHEYYMRTRELKGRRSTAALNDEGKEIWAYAKEQIKKEKASKAEAVKNQRTQLITAAREKAAAARERITAKLTGVKNKTQSSSERARIAAELKNVIAATREAYKAAKTQLDSDYEAIYQAEYDKILAEYAKPTKKSKKKKRKNAE